MLLLFGALFVAVVYRWISLERLQRFAPIEISGTPTPEPTATRPPVITGKLDTAKLFNGITLHSTVETTPGADATTERVQPESYVLDLKLQARVPSPNRTIEELAKVIDLCFGELTAPQPLGNSRRDHVVLRGCRHGTPPSKMVSKDGGNAPVL